MNNNNDGRGRGGNNWRGRGGGWGRTNFRWGRRGQGSFRGRGRGVDNAANETNVQNNPGNPGTSRPNTRESLGYGSFIDEQGSKNHVPPAVSEPPGPPKKKRKYNTMKNSITTAWKKKLPGFKLYYPDLPPKLPDVDKKISAISEYLERKGYFSQGRMFATHEKEYFEVICENVKRDNTFKLNWPTFIEDLIEEPSEVVNLWGAVMHKVLLKYFSEPSNLVNSQNESFLPNKNLHKVGKIQAGLCKIDPVTPLISVNSSHLGKFVTIRGQIVGTGVVRAVCLQMVFLCRVCETEFLADQPHGIFTVPKRCGVSDDCDYKGPFDHIETSDDKLMIDNRKIKVQDVLHYEGEHGSVPRTIECEVTNGLVHQCSTGDNITISGIVRMKKETNFNGEQNLLNLYIEVISMKNHKESERTMGGNWFSFSDKDFYAMEAIYKTPNLFKLLVASLCPSIYGHLYVKAALILSLFGGTPYENDILSRRSDINILMIGDPGIGKSQLLKIVTEVAPQGVYVCGTGSTVAGLTITLVRDGSEYSLEAGALVMADKGICCIDEFDKMVPQHPALLEAMEQQSVSIAKSGVFRTLPARTTVIAAANPVGGHYDRRKSVSENIKIGTPLLSRFDVTFILLDKANKEFDQRIVEHIMGNVKGKRKTGTATQSSVAPSQGFDIEMQPPLINRLQVDENESLDLIPHCLIRKYIAYCRQRVKPKISHQAAVVLKEYYLQLRERHRSRNSTPITTRQLESLVRLTEARAKLEHRTEATANDAKDILEIFESSLSSAFDDEVTAVSAMSESILLDMIESTGSASGRSQSSARSQAKRLMGVLQRMAEQQCKNMFSSGEIKTAIKSIGLSASPDGLISMLNNEGFMLHKGGSTYQILSADY